MLALTLPEIIEQRLAALAQETGRTKTTLAREAVLEYIDDLEDHYLAEARARKNTRPFRSTM
jgi:RHH-type rel operon transcriptional repressor/antitoxin RelB